MTWGLVVGILLVVTVHGCAVFEGEDQCNPAWSNVKIGHSSYGICANGSALTAAASLLLGWKYNIEGKDANPVLLNEFMIANKLYVDNWIFPWAALETLNPISLVEIRPTMPLNRLKKYLDSCAGMIVNTGPGTYGIVHHLLSSTSLKIATTSHLKNATIPIDQIGLYIVYAKDKAMKRDLLRISL